ncbi:MAG TPA: complex I NDUFA9 subunit family protein [Alphaproteobacteria bacterium]|nr:complex I NDUFA9 subunit family protein [Alphaproteobacteria bacterium]
MALPFTLAGSQVTVFGGSGFIGRHLVQRLAAAGAVIKVAVRHPDRALFLKPLGDVGQIVPVRADILNAADIEAAVKGASAVVNLVGILFESKKRSFDAVHHKAAGAVAAAAKDAGALRLVHVSALGANKSSPARYARTKALGEDAVLRAYPQATIMRPSIVFGPEDNFFNLFAMLARLSPVLPVMGASPRLVFAPGKLPVLNWFGKGGPRFQPVYVGDVASAIVQALDRPEAQGKRYELGGPRTYTMKEIVELVLRETGRKRLLIPAPFPLLSVEAAIFEFFRLKLLTRDQLRLLQRDNVVSRRASGLADLGIAPTTVEIMLPTYLGRFRRAIARA